MTRAIVFVALAIPTLAVVAGCGGEATDTVSIFAASSLSGYLDVFEPSLGVNASYSYAGSNALVRQALDGAPVDIVITADIEVGAPLTALPGVRSYEWVRNALTIAVPEGNPAGVRNVTDLDRNELRVAICAADVPCGRQLNRVLSAEALRGADTVEPSVRSVLAKVRSGEVDAGLVYLTDAMVADADVDMVPIADAPTNVYMVYLMNPDNPHALAWFDALDTQGRTFLAERGFLPGDDE